MQSTLAGDAVCLKRGPIKNRVAGEVGRFEAKMNRVKIEATQYLKAQGVDTTVLPRPATISNRAVYSSINRCVFQIDLGTTFVMKAAILLVKSTLHCYPGTDKQRVCAVDIIGLFAVLSLAVRFLGFAGDSCIAIIGRTDNNALCVGLWAGVCSVCRQPEPTCKLPVRKPSESGALLTGPPSTRSLMVMAKRAMTSRSS